MKRLFRLPTLSLLAATVLLLGACEITPDGPDPRDPFLGGYNAVDRCSADTIDYFVDIFKTNNTGETIWLGGMFAIPNLELEAVVTGIRFVIPIQQYQIGSDPGLFYEFSGNGTLDNNEITIDYQVLTIQNGTVLSDNDCIATLTPQ